MATQGWVADRLSEWVKHNPSKGAKDAKEKVEQDYGIKLKYSKAWSGLKLALEQVHGKYEESFQLLFNWKAQMKLSSPGSIIEIDLERKNKKMCFKSEASPHKRRLKCDTKHQSQEADATFITSDGS